MKATQLVRLIRRELGYEIVRQRGSHKHMQSPHHPDILFSYHDGVSVPPGVVRKILTKDIGLTDAEARRLLGMKG